MLSKMSIAKNVIFNEKKIRKIWMIFDIENSLWKSNFCTLRQAGTARQSIQGRLQSGRMANFVKPFWKIGLPNVSLPRWMTLMRTHSIPSFIENLALANCFRGGTVLLKDDLDTLYQKHLSTSYCCLYHWKTAQTV